MGAVAITSQKLPAASSGEPTQEGLEWIEFARRQEIQCLKDYYENQIRMLQNTHTKEKRALKQENQKLKNDIRVQKIINTKLRKQNATMMEAGADLQTELQQVRFAMKKLQEDKDVEIIETRHKREKRTLMEKVRELKDFVRSLKMKNNNLKKDSDTRMENLNKLQLEHNKLMVIYNELQKNYVTVLGTEVRLRKELQRVKTANENLNKYWESKTADCEKEKQILATRIEELQKELEEIKTNVPVQNLQLVGFSSQRQQDRQCGTDIADDGKVSLNNFQFVKKLGKGAFGSVVLAKGKLPGGTEHLYAIKAIEKRRITSRGICRIIGEKEALMLTSAHPFITTLHASFQNKDHIFFVMEYMSGGDLKGQLDEVEVFSEKRARFYAAEITLGVQFLHQQGILHRDLKLENVLVDTDGHCKIADFGLSKLGLFRPCKARTHCGTPFCMAPEIVKNLPYDQGVDWWAVGVMIFEMITGNPPFDYDEEEESDDDSAGEHLDHKILNDEVDYPENMSPAAVSIVEQLLVKNPEQRLGSNGSVDAIRQHPFFKAIDWQALHEKRVKPPEEEKAVKKPEEDNKGFSNVLKVQKTPGFINQDLFQGFSFVNYRVKPG